MGCFGPGASSRGPPAHEDASGLRHVEAKAEYSPGGGERARACFFEGGAFRAAHHRGRRRRCCPWRPFAFDAMTLACASALSARLAAPAASSTRCAAWRARSRSRCGWTASRTSFAAYRTGCEVERYRIVRMGWHMSARRAVDPMPSSAASSRDRQELVARGEEGSIVGRPLLIGADTREGRQASCTSVSWASLRPSLRTPVLRPRRVHEVALQRLADDLGLRLPRVLHRRGQECVVPTGQRSTTTPHAGARGPSETVVCELGSLSFVLVYQLVVTFMKVRTCQSSSRSLVAPITVRQRRRLSPKVSQARHRR